MGPSPSIADFLKSTNDPHPHKSPGCYKLYRMYLWIYPRIQALKSRPRFQSTSPSSSCTVKKIMQATPYQYNNYLISLVWVPFLFDSYLDSSSGGSFPVHVPGLHHDMQMHNISLVTKIQDVTHIHLYKLWVNESLFLWVMLLLLKSILKINIGCKQQFNVSSSKSADNGVWYTG